MKKRILLLGGNFYPELTGIGKYNGEMIDWLAGHGHECTVVTTYPYYPYWKVQKPYDHSFWYRMEKYILKNADLITSISAGMIRKIEKKGAGNIKYFPNWVDVELFYPVYDKERLKRSFGFSDTDRIVLYSGGIGEKQGLDSIIYAAEALKKYNDVKFV